MEKDRRIGLIGCGSMGGAIAGGIISSRLIQGAELSLYDIAADKAKKLRERLNATLADSPSELVNACGTVILAVKPQDIEGLLRDIARELDSSKFVISIAAGVSIERIKSFIAKEVRVARAMPNIAALIGKGISALCYDEYVLAEDKALARDIFGSLGAAAELDEFLMNAVTAVSASGPAYFFYLAEILQKSAVDMGIDEKTAEKFIIHTVLGSAILLKDSGLKADELRRRVTSKGGTTEAAFRVFDEKNLGDILKAGIKEAAERAKKLNGGAR